MKESHCKPILAMKCNMAQPDFVCRFYRESLRTPLKCAYRIKDECLNVEAIRAAAPEVMKCHVKLSAV
jgi:hypothetical protein